MVWTNVENEKIAIVIANFIPPADLPVINNVPYLSLLIGDILDIKREEDDWYYGQIRIDASRTGLFPKSYVNIKESPTAEDRNSSSSTSSGASASSVCSSIVKETTIVLRQWMRIGRKLYSDRKQAEFSPLISMMKDLLDWRKKVMDGKLPIDRLQDLKLKMSRKIDVGNKKLGLDLVIRHDNGNIVELDSCSIMELYELHCSANDRIQNDSRNNLTHSTNHQTQGNWCLLINISDFLIRTPADAEVFLALYDGLTHQYISEFFTVYLPLSNDESSGGTLLLRRSSNISGGFVGAKLLFTDFGNKDAERKKVFLVCKVIKFGPYDSNSIPRKISTSTSVRQTYAVGALDISDMFSAMTYANDDSSSFTEDQELGGFIQLHVCESKFEETLQRVLEGRTGTLMGTNIVNGGINNHSIDTRDQGVWLSVQRLWGNVDEVLGSESFPSAPVVVLRKIGFPEVISREDVRNDMYITLVGGDFKESGKERNIEVKVALVNQSGDVYPDSFVNLGVLTKKEPYFVSTVFQHEHRPRWNDMFKLAIPVDKYSDLHLRFTFKHRSSNESKDKAEKPFGLSYIRLIQDNGTILMNGDYDLNVYKLDKKFDDTQVSYLDLPSTKAEIDRLLTSSSSSNNSHHTSKNANLHNSSLTLCSKDVFHIKSVVCSTSLTQNIELLGLLGWESKQNQKINLRESLQMIMKLESDKIGAEIVKFLHDVLDVLFNILTTTKDYDELAFDALVYIIVLIDDKRFHSFKPVMDTYLKKSFSAVIVHSKLLEILNRYICNVEKYSNQLYLALKSLDYLMKFIVQSRYLYIKSLGSGEINDDHLFAEHIRSVYDSLIKLLASSDKNNLKYQAAALRYIHFTVNEVITVFDPAETAELLLKMLNKAPVGLNFQKLSYIKHLVNSDIFKKFDCRKTLLPKFLIVIQKSMENNEDLELCSGILTDIMKVLYSKSPEECHTESADLVTVVRIILRSLMQLIIRLPELKPIKVESVFPSALKPAYVSLLMEIFNQLDATSCRSYINSFAQPEDLMDFTIELFMLFKDLIENLPFSSDWFQMITFQNSVILKILGFMATTVRLRFSTPFRKEVYDNFFLTCVSFITQKHLQIETFNPSKRMSMLKKFRDMRFSCAKEVRDMWSQMNLLKKAEFIPSLVGPMLRVTLIPQSDLRQQTIPIFLDMIITGLYHKPKSDNKEMPSKTKFVEFERELILQLDYLVDNGSGDSDYTDSFTSIMEKHLLTHKDDWIKHTGTRLTTVVKRLMNRLLEFRDVKQNHDCTDNSMSCLYSLLEFYREIEQTELYVRYLYKLYDLHMNCENFVEAASTLKLHADQLDWSEESVPEELLSQEKFRDSDGRLHTRCSTERHLKENLYYQIICLYDKGKLWEKAIVVCKELQEQYEENTLEYEKLSDLLERMSKMYKNIMTETNRNEPEYFRAAFYGRGFPTFLQNRVFVYRGQPYERIADFSSRMKSQFPKAILMQTLAPPTDEQSNSAEQYLQIAKVDTVANDHPKTSLDRNVASKIAWYCKYNDVQKFSFARRLPNRQSDIDLSSLNDTEKQIMIWWEQTVLVTSYTFPGVLRCFPVISSKATEISPLQMAIEQMNNATRELAQTVEECERLGEKLINSLELRLQGIVNPAVQGGITNYEHTFFTEKFISKCSEKELQSIDQLKDVIASQIPILEKGLFIHAKYCVEDQRNFHDYLVKSFEEYRKRVEEKYGKKPSLLPVDASIHIIRPRTLAKHISVDNMLEDRLMYLTLPRSNPKKDTTGLFTVRNVNVAAVPRRVHTKRKTTQSGNQSFNENDVNKRLSNTSIGSNNSIDSVQTLNKNGPIMEIGEIATPQRPLRPSVSSASSRRPSNSQPLKDRQPSAVFHRPYTTSLDEDIDITPVSTPIVNNLAVFADTAEKAPPLPPRPNRRNNSTSAASLVDQINNYPSVSASPVSRTAHGHDFVLPRKNKPLPPKP